MGRYLTQTGGAAPAGDLTDAFGNALLSQLCSDGSGLVSATRVASVIMRAEGMIDVELGPSYTVPAMVPDHIKTIAIMLCEFFLYSNAPEFRRADGSNPASESFKTARDMLKSIRDGSTPLLAAANETSPVVGSLVDSDDDRGWGTDTSTDYDWSIP